MPEKYEKKVGGNVHQNSGVGAICPPSKILCDLGQNVMGQNVLGAFCLLGQNVSLTIRTTLNQEMLAHLEILGYVRANMQIVHRLLMFLLCKLSLQKHPTLGSSAFGNFC